MQKPVIALIGRPNVGKSTLFNRLSRSRDAIVADYAGLTRDRQYGTGRIGKHPYIVVDTGGLDDQKDGVVSLMAAQVRVAIEDADAVLFLVDGRAGLLAPDLEIAQYLRRFDKPIHLLINKAEGQDRSMISTEFYQMGLGSPLVISSAHGDGVVEAIDFVLDNIEIKEEKASVNFDEHPGIRVAVIGRPNVGKSTLINRMIGEDRLVAFDLPGTTRDSIYVPFERDNQQYTLIDTAGVRRRKNISEKIEKFSIVKAISAMEFAHVVILVIDATEGVSDQDATLLGLAINSGRGLLLAINKWDHIGQTQKQKIKQDLEYKLQFVDYAKQHLISALHGTGVGLLFKTVNQVYQASMKRVGTSDLNRVLEQAVLDHQPPLIGGRRIKLRFAHLGGLNPPTVVIHGNQLDKLSEAYTRYLMGVFRKAFNWAGTPIRISYKLNDNPFKDRPRQNKSRIKGKSKTQSERLLTKRKQKKSKQPRRRSE